LVDEFSELEANACVVTTAMKACELTRYQNQQAIIALIDAHSVAGNIAAAVLVAERPLQMAEAPENEALADLARSRLQSLKSQLFLSMRRVLRRNLTNAGHVELAKQAMAHQNVALYRVTYRCRRP
jgi:hypothetical protein